MILKYWHWYMYVTLKYIWNLTSTYILHALHSYLNKVEALLGESGFTTSESNNFSNFLAKSLLLNSATGFFLNSEIQIVKRSGCKNNNGLLQILTLWHTMYKSWEKSWIYLLNLSFLSLISSASLWVNKSAILDN